MPRGRNRRETIIAAQWPHTADVWKKDVWDIQSLSQAFLELRFFLENEGKDGKNLSFQTWPGSPDVLLADICGLLNYLGVHLSVK